MSAEIARKSRPEAAPRATSTRVIVEFHPLDYDPRPYVLSPEQRATLDALWPREGRKGDPLCLCCGELISPDGLKMLST